MSIPSAGNMPRGLTAAFFAATTAACFVLAWKQAALHGEPALVVLVMLIAAAVLNTLTALLMARRVPAPSHVSLRPMILLAAALAVFTLLGNLLSAEAIRRISGPMLAVVQRCEVIVVALLGALVLREPVRRTFWVGAATAGVGLVLLHHPELDARGFDPAGAFYALGSAVCFGAMIVLSRRYIQHVQPFSLNALRLWASLLLWMAVEQRLPPAHELSPQLLAYGSLAGFLGPFLSRLGVLLSSRDLPANLTAMCSLITPVLTVALGFALFRELPSQREILGGSIMLVGVAIPVTAIIIHEPTL